MTALARYQYWIFDLDGTLTLPIHDFAALRRQLGIPQGQPILEYLATLPQPVAAARHQALHAYETALASRAQAQPGCRALLQGLVTRGRQLGILTRNGEAIAEATLHACGLRDFFRAEVIIGRETCAPKPQPDGVLHLLHHWQAAPEAALLVGDYHFDLEAARRANIRTVHFAPDGNFAWPELTDYTVQSHAELARYALHQGG